MAKPRVPLGQLVATPGALSELAQHDILRAVQRHTAGDWGDVCDEDRQANDWSLANGERLVSVYRAANGRKFYVITESDRSATTVLLPEEY